MSAVKIVGIAVKTATIEELAHERLDTTAGTVSCSASTSATQGGPEKRATTFLKF